MVPACAIVCLFAMAACAATVVKYHPDGSKTAEIKVPLGMQYDAETDTLSGDPKAIEAMGNAATKAIEVGGEAVTKFAIEQAAKAAAQQQGAQ